MAEKQPEKSELHTDSIKAAAESMGINNLSEDAASLLADDATYRIKQVVSCSGGLWVFTGSYLDF